MIIAGAKCDRCGRIEAMDYISDTAVEVMLRQKGWKFEGKKSICRVCSIEEKNKKKNM